MKNHDEVAHFENIYHAMSILVLYLIRFSHGLLFVFERRKPKFPRLNI